MGIVAELVEKSNIMPIDEEIEKLQMLMSVCVNRALDKDQDIKKACEAFVKVSERLEVLKEQL